MGMKWLTYQVWNNWQSWNPDAVVREGDWQYDETSDVLRNLAAQEGFSGLVDRRFLTWDDYAVECAVSAGPQGGGVGLAFRWQDERNFYFFLMDAGGLNLERGARLGKVVEGVLSYLPALPRGTVRCVPGRLYAVRVVVTESRLRVWVDGVLQFDLEDGDLQNGAFGPLSVLCESAGFSNFKAYFLPIQVFQSGVGDMDDCRVAPPAEQLPPVEFAYGVRQAWKELKEISVFPTVGFSYMVWAEGFLGGGKWISQPHQGYASVNGRPPLANDGDGFAPAYVRIPNIEVPPGVVDIEYVVGNISSSDVTGIFVGTGKDRTSDPADVVKFECHLTEVRQIELPVFSEETVYTGQVLPDSVYVSPPFVLSEQSHLVIRSLTPGVDVWVDGNVVYAKLAAGSAFGSWHPYIHSGYYAFGDKLHYLYAKRCSVEVELDENLQAQIIPLPCQGAPVVVTDARGRFLRHVSFIDDAGGITLYNVEKFSGLESDTVYLMYDDLEDVQVTVNGVPVDFLLSGHVLSLPYRLRPNDVLVVRYKLRGSYCIRPYVTFGRPQNRIVDVSALRVSRVAEYSVFELAYVPAQYIAP